MPASGLSFSADDYSELLGLYLGDGHITQAGRTNRLRLFLDAKHRRVVDEARQLLERCFGGNRVGRASAEAATMAVLSVYNAHLPCLFPQHGPGPKHLRPILLEDWQREIVSEAPWPLLRGLIRSDGCSFVNRTGPYEYLSYAFTNRSKGIIDLFLKTSRELGLRPRVTYFAARSIWQIRINRRGCVARMRKHVGVKD